MEDVFRAIADPTRRALIDELRGRNDQTLFELCTRLITGRGIAVSRQAVSKHLAVLAGAGLIKVRRQGRTSIHHFDPAPLVQAIAWLDAGPTPNKEQH